MDLPQLIKQKKDRKMNGSTDPSCLLATVQAGAGSVTA